MEENKKSASPKKNSPVEVGVGGCVGEGIEGRAQNIAPLHLMRCLIVRGAGITWRRWVGIGFLGFVRIWTKTERFCGPKAK